MKKSSISLIALFLLFFISEKADTSDTIKQETKGDQSPAVYVSPGGRAEINYKSDAIIEKFLSEMSVMRRQFQKCFDIAVSFQNKKLEELNKELAELYIQQSGSSEEEARKWAQDILEKAPEVKKQRKTIEEQNEKYNKEFSKNLLAKTYSLFSYIYGIVDSRFEALQEVNPQIKYEISKDLILFVEDNNNIISYNARETTLQNGNKIFIVCSTGKMQKGVVSTCPLLEFKEIINQKTVQSFYLKPDYGGHRIILHEPGVQLPKKIMIPNEVNYLADGSEILTEDFKKKFNVAFIEFLKIALSR